MSGTVRHEARTITASRARWGLASTALANIAVLAMAAAAAGQAASPDGGALALVPGESLSPGTYHSRSVGDATFVVGDGWVSTYDAPGGGFGLVRVDTPGTFDVALFEGDALAEGCEPGGATIDATPEALMGYIARAGGIATATEPAPVAIGGLEGLSIDITTSEREGCPGPAVAWLVPTLGRFFILPDSATRIIGLDAGDHVITIIVDAPVADAEAFRTATQPIIDSLVLGAAAPSGAPSASGPAASPRPSMAISVGACVLTADRDPAWDETFYLAGTGYQPEVDIELTFVEPTGTSSWGGPNGVVQPAGLHTDPDGAFGPYDITYTEPTSADYGAYVIRATDGACEAAVSFTLSAP